MGITNIEDAKKFVEEQLEGHKVVVFSKTYCPYCVKVIQDILNCGVHFAIFSMDKEGNSYPVILAMAKKLLKTLDANAHEIELDEMDSDEGSLIQEALKLKTKQSTVPNIFINHKHIGGCDDLHGLHKAGKLAPLLQ